MSSKIVLCDIEGTTTSISFVKDNLFPYAAKNVDSFLDAHWDEDDTKEAVKMLRDQSEADKKEQVDGCVDIAGESEEKAKQIESIVANVKWQMEHDRKAGPLKNLQGLMWVDAYKAGSFKGQVYEDVAPALESWSKAGRKIYIYSSGSVAIQKVHFEHSEAGDLAKYLSGYYDTKVGAKQEKGSYETIFKEISKDEASLNSADVLFLTDVPAEAKAAKEAGMEAILVKRPGNAALTDEDSKAFKVVESFADIPLDKKDSMDAAGEEPQKRKIEADAQESSPPAKVAKIDAEAVPSPLPAKEDGQQTTATKTEGEIKDAPLAEPEKSESSGDQEMKTEEKQADAPEKAETMEVDSTTTTEQEEKKTATTSDDPVVAKTEGAKKTPCDEVEMKETAASEAETKTVTDKESPKDTEAKKQVEVAEEAKETAPAEEKKDVAETAKVEEKAKENGAATVVAADEATSTEKNGEAEKVEANGTGADAKAQNGTKEANGHDDSDKENDKSMEAQPDEVSTTSGPAAESESAADLVAAKKCAIDPQAPADQATPVPAEVEAES